MSAQPWSERRRDVGRATMGSIRSSNGMEISFDDEDAALVSGYTWAASCSKEGNPWYASAYVPGTWRRRKTILMHRLILGARPGERVDHRDGNGLNNRRSNLRQATNSQNRMNSRPDSTNTSGVRGVCFHRQSGKWRAFIEFQGKRRQLGSFNAREEAVVARSEEERRLFGEFSYLARPSGVESDG